MEISHEQFIALSERVSKVEEKASSAHHRISENERMTEGIHKLAANMEALTVQVKLLTEQMEAAIERIEAGQRLQGERLGALEKAFTNIRHNEEAIKDHCKRIEAIEKAPGDKWNKAVWLTISGAIGAVISVVATFFTQK